MELDSLIDSATILAIDDELPNLVIIEKYLTPVCKKVIIEHSSRRALILAKEKQPDIILLDILMSYMNGYEVCKKLKADRSTAHIPIIFLSSLNTAQDKVKGFAAGGADYICKPFHLDEMRARIENCLKLHRQIYQTQINNTQNKQERIKNYRLTERELEILVLYAKGKSRSEIANKLEITEETVKFHLKNVFLKLKVNNKVLAVHKAWEIGLVD